MRSGRHGQAWTTQGPLNITNARFAEDLSPLDAESDCPASRDYSKAYLHHLFKAGELLGQVLLSWHNVAYYQALMTEIRTAIAEGRYTAFRDGVVGAVAALPRDTVVSSHFVAINAVIGAAIGDDRLVIRSLDNCSVTVVEADGHSLQLVEGGHEADTLIR